MSGLGIERSAHPGSLTPLTPILRGMSKGAKMQAVFRDRQLLRVCR
jgi:hypothetical protein